MAKNIIILTIDALRADHVSFLEYERDTTPRLTEFSNRCAVFKSAYAASSHTRESVPALLSGHYPADVVTDRFSRNAATLPMLLSDEYATAGFHSNPYISRAYGYDDGFDMFDDDLRMGQNKFFALIQRVFDKFLLNRGQYHARAEDINDRAVSWLSSLAGTEPFLLWNHYMDVHGPYNPPEGYSEWSDTVSNAEAQRLYDKLSGDESPTDEEVVLAKNLYDGEIRYVDAQIGAFLDMLQTRGLLENSIVMVTSDHGDLFGEYGQYTHPRYLYPELTRVPMLVSGANVTPRNISAPTSTLDIVPTTLDAAGDQSLALPGQTLLAPERLAPDRSVFSSVTGEGANNEIRRFAVQTSDLGVRFTRNQRTSKITQEQYYKLPSGSNISSDSDPRLQPLYSSLVEHSDMYLNVDSTTVDEEATSLNADIEDRLEALGYR